LLDDACNSYIPTVEEFLDWQRSVDRHGLASCGQPISGDIAHSRAGSAALGHA
jgi:Protein of unknown function (DUF1153)